MYTLIILIMLLGYLAPADWIAIVAISIPTLGGVAWLIYRAGGLVELIGSLKTNVDDLNVSVSQLKTSVSQLKTSVSHLEIRFSDLEISVSDLKVGVDKIPAIENRLVTIEARVDSLWRQNTTSSNSPMVLNDLGRKILEDSKVADLIDHYYSDIIRNIKSLNPQNSFQAQETLITVVSQFRQREDCKDKLEQAAFNSAQSVDQLLFVAAINLRDKVFSDLGYDKGDIDRRDPGKQKPLN
jgi:hypothetical protein